MSNVIKVTSRTFSDLTCPYTGKKLDVYMIPRPDGSIGYFAPSAYTPRARFKTSREAYDNWARREGFSDVAKGDNIRCPYTGDVLTLMSDQSGYWYSGGYDPGRVLPRDEFLYYASMRDGVSRFPAPGHVERVEPVLDARRPPNHKTVEISDFSMKQAENIMKKSGLASTLKKETVVSMSVPSRRKSK